MKLIYMEITHNTDDSVGDLSSLVEGEEWGGSFFFHSPWLVPAFLDSFCKFASEVHPTTGFRSCTPKLETHAAISVHLFLCLCVCDGERVCELLSLR